MKPSNESGPLLTERETATYLAIKPQTLAAWRCNGKYRLRFVRVGRAIRYRRTDVEEFLDARTRLECE